VTRGFNYIKALDETTSVFATNGVHVGEIIALEDGFYNFFPEMRGGCWPSWALRELADVMDEMNEPWQKQIDEFFEGG
jgi:NAD(P)H-nitrite reductase large subunit